MELKASIAAAVRDAEQVTAAEIVVSVRPRSGTYRDVHFAVGFAFALLILVALLYLPTEFPLWTFGVELVVAFAVGALFAAWAAPLTRALIPGRRLDEQVRDASHAMFFSKGVSRTTGRFGVLVYVSLFEQRVSVVPDIGVDTKAAADAWNEAVASLECGARDPSSIAAGVRALGAALAVLLPRGSDDQNELSDDVDTGS